MEGGDLSTPREGRGASLRSPVEPSRSPPITINLGRYNSGDVRSICYHLTLFKARVLIKIRWTSRPRDLRAPFLALSIQRSTLCHASLTCRFCASLKHKDDGQTKFIKPNSQRQDIIIKYCVCIGSIHKEQG